MPACLQLIPPFCHFPEMKRCNPYQTRVFVPSHDRIYYPSCVAFRANPYGEGISAIALGVLIRVEKNRKSLSTNRIEDWEIAKVPGE